MFDAHARISDRYEVVRTLGTGGAGTTHLCRDLLRSRVVALKILSHAAPELLDSLRRELAALRALRHPSLVEVLGFGRARVAGQLLPFLTTAWVDGAPISGGGASFAALVPPLVDGLRALAALHASGLRHGDVKPDNLLVAAGRGVLIDLGACAPFGPVAELSGTPGYLAPELLAGGGDGRADLFAFGVMLRALVADTRGAPHALGPLIDRLLASDPAARPADARAVISALAPDAELVTTAPLPVALVGRAHELAAGDALVQRLGSRQPGPRVLALRGAPGSGRTALLDELAWRVGDALEIVELTPTADLLAPLAARAGVAPPTELVAIAALAERLGDGAPLLVLIDDADRDDALPAALLALLRCAPPGGTLGVILATHSPVPGALELPLEPLTADAAAAWLAGFLPGDAIAAVTAAAGGLPGAMARLARLVHDGRASLADLPALARRDADPVSPSAHLALAAALAGAGSGRPGARTGSEGDDDAIRLAARVRHLALGGDSASAEALLATSEAPARFPGRFRSSLDALAPLAATPSGLMALARLALALGRPELALRLLPRARRRHAPAAAVHALAGAAYVARGDTQRAIGALGRALAADASDAVGLAGQLVVALNKQGDYAGALALADRSVASAREPLARADLACGAAVAAIYLGDEARARDELDHAERALADQPPDAPGPARLAARAALARALLASRTGQAELAAASYRAAIELARRHGLDELALSASLNLGAACHKRGELGPALEAYEHAVRLATALGQPSRRHRALYNLGTLYADLGQPELAGRALDEVALAAAAAGQGALVGAANLVLGELAVARGDRAVASRHLDAAVAGFGAGSPRDLAEVELARAAVAAADGRGGAATALIDGALAAAERAGADDIAGRALLTRGRALIATGRAAEAIAALERADGLAEKRGHRLLGGECAAALATAFAGLGSAALATRHRQRAIELFERVATGLPPGLRERFRELRLGPLTATGPESPASATGEVADLRRLLAVNRRLNSAMTGPEVLRETLDAAIELAGAERGFLIVAESRGGKRALEVPVARNLDREQIGRSHLKFSRSIAERVVASGEPVVAIDAGDDPRFSQNRSVHAMKLKSVLCVPITAPTGVLGAIYLDNRFRSGGFGARETELVLACADQAALALGRARMIEELAERSQALEGERARVEALLADKLTEVDTLAAELEVARASAPRRAFPGMIGASPALAAALAVLDRVADADVTVLVRGESGTGKELAARALHDLGHRKAGPFVAVNCGALPDNLLEAELFGYERGAFTGADRARAGLFTAASGGTIFLDELGETSLAMQVKLLRVLQEREVRPLGASAAHPIDVRVVTATNRDLKAEVAAGRFREDLYYRVAVVEVVMPPLRARVEDLPALAAAILTRIAADLGRPPPALAPAALRALVAQPWPGNIRELINVLTKAAVLADSGELGVADLDLVPVAASASAAGRRRRAAPPPADHLRELVARAGSATAAAHAAGVSRATFYRWLERRGVALGAADRPR